MNLSLLYYDIVCYIIAVCMFIICFVYIMLGWNLFMSKGSVNFGGENQFVELSWTIVPTMVVLVLCALNVNFITSDLDCFSSETIKIIGHQWYWTYEYPDGYYDSFMTKDCFLVDKPLRMFYGVPYHLVVTSADVIHSFSVPSLNLKMDAIPGRLNHMFFCPSQHGSFIGYCAELCGVNHGVMPIVIEVIDTMDKFCFSISVDYFNFSC